jgi:hypothetical protein
VQPPLFAARLLGHLAHKRLEAHGRVVQAFDGQPLDGLMLMPDDEFLLAGIDRHINGVSRQPLLDVRAHIIKHDGSILTDLANEMLPIHMRQPGIWINDLRHTREAGQSGEGHPRGLIATRKRLIGPLLIVVLYKAGVGLSHLLFASGIMHQ